MKTLSIEKGFDEDGIRSIADKIKTRLHDLDKSVENNKGRWAWELLQNAKDSVADTDKRKVSVQIELNQNRVVFRHNGTHFDEQDVRGIINQISSKEVTEGTKRKQTGRFGTGFLTTHILSKVIYIEGIYESNDKEFSRFNFSLDRNGKTRDDLIPKIQKARQDFLNSIKQNKIDTHDESAYNTSFVYNLDTDEEKKIARVGIDEFTKLIPYVLASIQAIDSVEIIDNINNSKIKFENNKEATDKFIIEIFKTEGEKTTPIKLLFSKDNDFAVSIAAILETTENGYNILNLNNIPKLFCDFPLIGTEKFYFPVIVNSFDFTPQTERDGVWLKKKDDIEVKINREILEKAVGLYKNLLVEVAKGNFYNLFNIADTRNPEADEKYFDEKWYQNKIQIPLRESIQITPIVDTIRNGRVAIKENDSCVDFPYGINKEEREKICELCNIQEHFVLPLQTHIHKWSDILWTNEFNCNDESILKFISGKSNISELQESIGEKNVFEWLNEIYRFTIKEKKNLETFKKYSVLPNQKGTFKKRNDISKDQIKDDELKKIALQLGYDYYDILLPDEIDFDESPSTKTKDSIARQITDEINKYLKSGDEKENVKVATRQLTKWFKDNEEDGKKHFPELYKKREKLFLDTIKDQSSLYLVADNEEQLPTLAKIAEAIKGDSNILTLILNLIREKQELNELKEVGEYFEKVLADALIQHEFQVEKVSVGRDLIITLKNSKTEYSIEVKSTRYYDFVAMTPAQGKTASANPDNYALCVIHNDGTTPTVEYVRDNAKLILDIGEQVNKKVIKMEEFENKHSEISTTSDDIVLAFENGLDYKYQISNKIWGQGKTFEQFIKFISDRQTTILETALQLDGKQNGL